jgi:hypothetical protein
MTWPSYVAFMEETWNAYQTPIQNIIEIENLGYLG